MIEKEQIQAGDHSPWSELSLTTGLCNNLGDPPHLSATSGTPASLPTPRKKKKKKKKKELELLLYAAVLTSFLLPQTGVQ